MKRLMIIILALSAIFLMFTFFELKGIFFGFSVLIVLILLGIYDFFQKKHTILRNFPVIGHFRYLLEFIRPEIRQYFIASSQEERPFNRETRSLIYQRSKNIRDTVPFGTQQDVDKPGFESIRHSLDPKVISEE